MSPSHHFGGSASHSDQSRRTWPWRRSVAAMAATGGLILITGVAEAGVTTPITWGAAQTISGDSDVSTSGSLVYAYTFGTTSVAATTVNGVNFAAFGISNTPTTSSATVGSLTLQEVPGVLASYSNLGGSGAPFTSLTSGYQALLSSGGSADNPSTITVSLGGLIAGNQYSVQWWSSNSAGVTGHFGFSLGSTIASDPYANQVTLSSTAGGLGQYVIGTFTAVSSVLDFTLEAPSVGNNSPLINALQLRDLSATGVPGGAGVVGAVPAIVGLMRRRRRS